MNFNSITIRMWSALHDVIIKDGASQTQLAATMAEPVFSPCSGNGVREICVRRNAGN
jgi:hypothetical protein